MANQAPPPDPIGDKLDQLFEFKVPATPFQQAPPSPGLLNIDTAEQQAIQTARETVGQPMLDPTGMGIEFDDKDLRDIDARLALKANAIRTDVEFGEKAQDLEEYNSLLRLKNARAQQQLGIIDSSVRGLITTDRLDKAQGQFWSRIAMKKDQIKADFDLGNVMLDNLDRLGKQEIDIDTAMQNVSRKRIDLLGDSQRLANDLEFIKIAHGSNNIAQANQIISSVLGLTQAGVGLTASIVALA